MGMGEPLAISILRKKRDRIRDTIAKYEARLREAQADLALVVAALRLFEIDNNADEFPAYVDLNRVFRRGETTAFCMAALEVEGPLDTRELTARIMRSKGLDEHDTVLSQAIALRIVQTLRARRGKVDGTTRRKGVHLEAGRGRGSICRKAGISLATYFKVRRAVTDRDAAATPLTGQAHSRPHQS